MFFFIIFFFIFLHFFSSNCELHFSCDPGFYTLALIPHSGGGIAYSNQDYCTFLVILLSGGEPQGQGENVQTPLEGPFCRPHPGCGYRRCGAGDTPHSPTLLPCRYRAQGPSSWRGVRLVSHPRTNRDQPCLAW